MVSKILNPDILADICANLKKEDKKIVHCHGCFDLVHPGHIKHFEAARKYGDVLIVSLTEDQFVNKGPGRPIFNENIRAETIAALQTVDFVVINRAPTAVPLFEMIKPDYYVKGQDYRNLSDDITGEISNEKKAVEKYGGKLVFTEEIQFSSSSLINTFIAYEDDYVTEYLKLIRTKTSYKQIEQYFELIKDYRVLLIGDIILDEYQFVHPLGKSSKSATITAKMLDKEIYAGGVLAVANHIADFVSEVHLLTTCGINNGIDYSEFIKRHLHPNVKLHILRTPERPTTLKRRFLGQAFKHKIFEVIEINDAPLPQASKDELLNILRKTVNEKIDITVVADFGHGTIDPVLIANICSLETFLAVNTQTNSANVGYNLLTKYPRCDYFCIDQEEARLAVHDKISDITIIHSKLKQITHAEIGTVTLGINGALVGDKMSENPIHAPILSHEVVDTIGAGDAVLAITSLLAKAGVPAEVIALVGNSVGAMAVKVLGNKTSIQKIPLMRYIKTLLS